MFSPHCPTCGHQVLLGTDRIVRFAWSGGERAVVLRCWCGDVVSWNQQPPAAHQPDPADVCLIGA